MQVAKGLDTYINSACIDLPKKSSNYIKYILEICAVERNFSNNSVATAANF